MNQFYSNKNRLVPSNICIWIHRLLAGIRSRPAIWPWQLPILNTLARTIPPVQIPLTYALRTLSLLFRYLNLVPSGHYNSRTAIPFVRLAGTVSYWFRKHGQGRGRKAGSAKMNVIDELRGECPQQVRNVKSGRAKGTEDRQSSRKARKPNRYRAV